MMRFFDIMFGALVLGVALSDSARAKDAIDCKVPAAGSDKAPIFSPPRGNVVIGRGRLQFHSAPDARCAMKGVFVVPGDALTSYAETADGWVSVMYESAKGPGSVTGWARANRLRVTGTMGPE